MTAAAIMEQAYQHCQQIAQQHTENFPTASKLIRKELRPTVAAIYAFAREADDMADEGSDDAQTRLKKLDAWEVLLERCTKQTLDHPIFLALGDSIQRYHLSVDDLHDLLTAFRMDCTIQHYSHENELQFYCKHSANPVGRLMLTLHNICEPSALHASDCICTALQLTNFWQDLSIDLPRGRCYVPSTWLEEEGLSSDDLLADRISAQAFAPIQQRLVIYTHNLFQQGAPLLLQLPFRLRLQIAATLHGGMSILHAVAHHPDPLHKRPALQRKDWTSMTPHILQSTLFPKRIEQHLSQYAVHTAENAS